jgi:innexin
VNNHQYFVYNIHDDKNLNNFRFWFLFIAAITILAMIYSFVIITMPTSREAVLKRRLREAPVGIKQLSRRIKIGDFLLLHFLGQNINVKSYSEIVTSLYNNLCGESDQHLQHSR